MPPKGLTQDEVKSRQKEGRVNTFESPVSRSYADIVIKNFCTSFNLILIILGVALVFFDEYTNALAATGVILINVLISTIQEMKAKRRLDKIAVLLRPRVRLIRDGVEMESDPSAIVMDDIIRMESGDQAQVDGVVLECTSFEMDESLLTGESSTRRKHEGDTIYSGAYCVIGECYYRVTALGEDTFASKMLSSAKKFKKKRTPLQMETATVTEMLMIISFFYLALTVVINIFSGKHAIDSLIQSVIILDIVPIALFLLITITYMIAAVRMANSGILLQNSSSVESMSHVDTVCMDKTGTITTNNLVFDGAEYLMDEEEAKRIVSCFISSTGSRNHTVKAMESEYGRIDVELVEEIQFSSDRKFSAVHVNDGGVERSIFVGAYQVLRPRIVSEADVGEIISGFSRKGLRTVLICLAEEPGLYVGEDPSESTLFPVAIVSIRDEVRPDCREIISEFVDGGMDLKVISGDDPETVDALFTQAGIPGDRNIISGDQLEVLQGDDRRDIILKTNIFGRMKPDQKEDVIKTLRGAGRYVAMVGDGVNDVKSLKAAQVGVALQSGSGATRGVADMVLVDDRFDSLPKAIMEGKRTVTGMRDILRLYLTRNFVLAMLVGVLLLIMQRLPLLPIQNAYYALVTVSFAAFLMAIWAKPSDNKEMILPGVLRFCVPTALSIVVFALAIYAVISLGVSNGWFSDISFASTWEQYHALFPSESYAQFLDHMSGSTSTEDTVATLAEVAARNALLFFIVLAGIMELFLIYPAFKFMDKDGVCNRHLFPMFLAVLLFGVVAIVYLVPAISVGLASMMYLPIHYYVALIAVSIAWFVCAIIINRQKSDSFIIRVTEDFFDRRFQKELEKESDLDDEDRR